MKLLIKILASGFGSGYSPIASGTAGTVVAMGIYWFILPVSPAFQVIFLAIIIPFSVLIADKAEKIYGKKDDSHIVIDEFAGYWTAMLFLPHNIVIALAGFILFRIFDVIKPFFRKSQEWPGGIGIVVDDIFAGIMTAVILHAMVLLKVFPA